MSMLQDQGITIAGNGFYETLNAVIQRQLIRSGAVKSKDDYVFKIGT